MAELPELKITKMFRYNIHYPIIIRIHLILSTIISYSIPIATNVKLIIYNMLGQVVEVIENGYKNAGNYSVTFSADELPSGIYFYKIEAGQFSQVKKMNLIK